jgi:diaminohydroxyphosphoribosylaminopyrimidine deaminase/5-amino-6-(5-phosphoribosylamino)uracil reductase
VVELAAPNAADEGLNLAAALTLLSDQGITRLLVEAGPRLSTAFLRDDLVDQLAWYRGPTVMGGDGHAVFSSLNVERLADMKGFAPSVTIPLGDDNLTIYTRRLEA